MLRLALAIALLLVSATPARAQEETSEDAGRVIAAVEAALDNHDIDRAALFFDDDAMILSTTAVSGAGAVRDWLSTEFPSDATVEVSPYANNGSRVSWMSRITRDYARSAPRYQMTWDEAVVIDGRIKFWSQRPLIDNLSMPPEFRRAGSLDPDTLAAPPAGHGLGSRQLPLTVLSLGVGILIALAAGFALGIMRAPDRQQLHGGQLLAALQVAHVSRGDQRFLDKRLELPKRDF